MVQAARSGKQNIIEGSEASATSKETELKLTNVAKASLEELLEDYLDYLKTHQLAEWAKNSEKGLAVRRLGREGTWETLQPHFETAKARTRFFPSVFEPTQTHLNCQGWSGSSVG